MGCGSKPFASRLGRFSVLFVGCVVISLLSLSDFVRRLFSRFALIFVSCITISALSLSDFGRRLCFLCSFPVRCDLCELYHNQFSLSHELWSAAVLPGALCELYRTQLFWPLGLWSAAGLRGNLFFCWRLGFIPLHFPDFLSPFPFPDFPFCFVSVFEFPFPCFPCFPPCVFSFPFSSLLFWFEWY